MLGQRDVAESGADKRKLASAARSLLLPISKINGPMQDAASERLAKLGTTDTDNPAIDTSQPLPTTFTDSMAAANQILDEERNLALSVELLEQRGGDDKAELEQAKQTLSTVRQRGIDVLRNGLNLVTSETSETDVNQARASLAFLLYRSDRFIEAAVVGEFVARRFPSSELAVSSGLTALGAWQLELNSTADTESQAVMVQLQSTADYLVKRFPNDDRIAGAKELLVRVSITRGDFDAAQKFLEELPAENKSKLELQQAMGRLMWNRSLQLQADEDLDGAVAMRKQAAETLTKGLQALTAEQVNGSVLEAALLLAKVQLQTNSATALATLESDVYGPLKRLDDIEPPSENFRADVNSIALQVLVSELTQDGADVNALMSRSTTVMDRLQKAYAGQEDGDKKLVSTYFQLARDIRSQLESAPIDKKERLTGAFKLFLDKLSASTDDAKTLHWAAQTMLGLGQGQMNPNEVRATGQSEALITSATAILQRIESRGQKEPSWLSSEAMLTQVRLELGTAARLTGDYKTALDSLTTVLTENQMLVDAQVEAAMVYEQWASILPPQYAIVSYNRAISGHKPDANRKNIIWGWGSIAKKTMGNKDFAPVFFDARYHLALSRYLQGKKDQNAENATRTFEQALADIRTVFVRFPEMGGVASRKKFDLLTREIQKSLNTPVSGLDAFAQ
jgi:tetratricopeptide (TPR) repeat protein